MMYFKYLLMLTGAITGLIINQHIFAVIFGGLLGGIIELLFPDIFKKSVFGMLFPSFKNRIQQVLRFKTLKKIDILAEFLTELMVYVSVCDNEINFDEKNTIRNFLRSNYPVFKGNEKLISRFIDSFINKSIVIQKLISELSKILEYYERLYVIKFLYTIAFSDGIINDAEIECIEKIAVLFTISDRDHKSLRDEYAIKDTENCYDILNVSPDISNKELKAAYLKLVKKYHPDKAAQLGKEYFEEAHNQFIKIQDAYHRIITERNIDK